MKSEILLLCPGHRSTFVRIDASVLSEVCPTVVLGFDELPRPKIVFVPLRIFQLLVRRDVRAIGMWFSVPHLSPMIVILARIFHKRVFVFTGGYDVANVAAIQWGEMQSGLKRFLQRFALQRVGKVYAFSDFSRRDATKFARPEITSTLYQGVDTRHFIPSGTKRNMVVTTCVEINYSTIVQKGIQTFVDCARALPEFEFLVIGKVADRDKAAESLIQSAPANVKFTNRFVSDAELLQFYQQSKVYVQASAHEGFGIACAEAMACECVPVGTYDTSLPEVIGDAGFLVKFSDIAGTVEAIEKAAASGSLGMAARKRVVQLFDLEIRAKRLRHEIALFLQ